MLKGDDNEAWSMVLKKKKKKKQVPMTITGIKFQN